MASTITFRPGPGVADALTSCAKENGLDRSALINAALVQYLGMGGDTPVVGAPARSGDESQASEALTTRPRPRRARQAVPNPPGVEPPECPHPKSAEKKLQFGVQCTVCGRIIR
jgi:hypothetical protein